MAEQSFDRHIKKFANLAVDVADFNRANHSFSGLGSILAGHIRDAVGSDRTIQKTSVGQSAVSCAENLFNQHREILTAIGLELIQDRTVDLKFTLSDKLPSNFFSDEGNLSQTDCISFKVVDSENLIKFLGTITPRAAESEVFIHAVNLLGESIQEELQYGYLLSHFNNSLESWDKSLDSYCDIVSEFRRFGAADQADQIAGYLDHSLTKTLPEYMLVVSSDLLGKKPFNARLWHNDCTEMRYETHWNDTLKSVEIIKRNKKAKSMLDEVLDYLDASVITAKKELTEALRRQPVSNYHRDHAPGMLEVLDEVTRKLYSLRFE